MWATPDMLAGLQDYGRLNHLFYGSITTGGKKHYWADKGGVG